MKSTTVYMRNKHNVVASRGLGSESFSKEQSNKRISQCESQFIRAQQEHKSFYNAHVQEIRLSLMYLYENSILDNPKESISNGWEVQLWKNCFYLPICEIRKKLSILLKTFKDCSSSDQKRIKVVSGELYKYSNRMRMFLEGSLGFFHSMVNKMRVRYGISLDKPICGLLDPVSDEWSYYQLCASFFTYLGDITRYYRELNIYSDECWKTAWIYYMDVQRILPCFGNSFNQMALLSSYSNDCMSSFYYYARSIAVSQPSLNGVTNLERLIQTHSVAEYIGFGDFSNSDKNTSQIVNHFLSGICIFFVSLKSCSYEILGHLLTDFQNLLNGNCIQTFNSACIFSNHFGSTCLIQLVAWIAYSFWKLKQILSFPNSVYEALIHLIFGLISSLLQRLTKDEDLDLFADEARDLLPCIALIFSWLGTIQIELICVKFDMKSSLQAKIWNLLKSQVNSFLTILFEKYKEYINYYSVSCMKTKLPPLPEQMELHCYIPFEKVFENLDFQLPVIDHKSQEATWRRCVSIVEFLGDIAAREVALNQGVFTLIDENGVSMREFLISSEFKGCFLNKDRFGNDRFSTNSTCMSKSGTSIKESGEDNVLDSPSFISVDSENYLESKIFSMQVENPGYEMDEIGYSKEAVLEVISSVPSSTFFIEDNDVEDKFEQQQYNDLADKSNLLNSTSSSIISKKQHLQSSLYEDNTSSEFPRYPSISTGENIHHFQEKSSSPIPNDTLINNTPEYPIMPKGNPSLPIPTQISFPPSSSDFLMLGHHSVKTGNSSPQPYLLDPMAANMNLLNTQYRHLLHHHATIGPETNPFLQYPFTMTNNNNNPLTVASPSLPPISQPLPTIIRHSPETHNAWPPAS